MSKEVLEEEHYSHGSRRDGRQGPTPKFRAYTSEEVNNRENSQSMSFSIFITYFSINTNINV